MTKENTLLDAVKYTSAFTPIGVDYLRLKLRKSRGNLVEEEKNLSFHMSSVLTTWRLDMGISLAQLFQNNTLAVWGAMRKMLNTYDDIIDFDRDHYPTRAELKHYPLLDGSKASDVISSLTELVKHSYEREKRYKIFKELIQLRDREYVINEGLSLKLKNRSKDSEPQIEALKLESSGLAMQSMARVINLINDVPREQAEPCEKAFYFLGKAGQYVDDWADFEKDSGDPANLVVNIAKLFPDEYTTLVRDGFCNKSLNKCPQTLAQVKERTEVLRQQIPKAMPKIRQSIAFFANGVPFYRYFETASVI